VGYPSPEMDRDEIARELTERLAAEGPRIACAWLFGSTARGTSSAGSDVDVAVLLRDAPPRTLEGLDLELQEDLAEVVGRPVQLVVANRAPVDLLHRVFRDGVLLVENDPSHRLPVLERYRRAGEDAA